MAVKTTIEWTDATWNPVTGCTPISDGCVHCYAQRMAKRLRGRFGYPADDPFRVTFHPDRLDQPLHWKKPRRIFVCSMADLFHKDVKDECIDKVFAVMQLAWWHTFMVLTKRPENFVKWNRRMQKRRCGYWCEAAGYLLDQYEGDSDGTAKTSNRVKPLVESLKNHYYPRRDSSILGDTSLLAPWPLPNVQFGVTCENQEAWKERKKWLLKCPATVRFVSAEPLLSDIQFGDLSGIDGVIAGGCTGPGAPPTHPDAFRSVRDQCAEAGVPFFLKSLGEWLPDPLEDWGEDQVFKFRDGTRMFRHGYLARKHEPKRLRELDGREHNELPEVK